MSDAARVSAERLDQLIHDAEIEAEDTDCGWECVLPLDAYTKGVRDALRELKARRDADA